MPDAAHVAAHQRPPRRSADLDGGDVVRGRRPVQDAVSAVPDDLLERLNASLLGAPTTGRNPCKVAAYSRTLEGVTAWGDRVSLAVPGCRVVARTGFGRDHMSTEYEANRQVLADIQALPLGPVQRWERED
jgi:hypothetical protein